MGTVYRVNYIPDYKIPHLNKHRNCISVSVWRGEKYDVAYLFRHLHGGTLGYVLWVFVQDAYGLGGRWEEVDWSTRLEDLASSVQSWIEVDG